MDLVLRLVDVFPMPFEKGGVRAECRIEGFDCFSIGTQQPAQAFVIVDMARDEDREVVAKRDQPAIEHPVRGTRKGEAVVHAVGAVRRDGADMRGGDFGTAAAIDEFEAGDRAALVVGRDNGGAENAVADDPRGQAFGADALLFEAEGALVVVEDGRQRRRGIAEARQRAVVIAEAEIDDADKVLRAERPHRGLRIGKAAFDQLAIDCPRDVVREIEIGVGFDERDIMAVARRIGNDAFNTCNGIKAATAGLHRLIINGPITFELAGPRQIDFGELILAIGFVGIMRIAAMDKNPRHCCRIAKGAAQRDG